MPAEGEDKWHGIDVQDGRNRAKVDRKVVDAEQRHHNVRTARATTT